MPRPDPLPPGPPNCTAERAESPLPATIGHDSVRGAASANGRRLWAEPPRWKPAPNSVTAARHWAEACDARAAGHVVVFSLPEPQASREKGRTSAAGARPAGSSPASASRPQQRGLTNALVPTPPNPSSCVPLRLLNSQRLADGVRRQSPTLP